MAGKHSLEEEIRDIGSPVRMLREARQGPYALPLAAEYSNWRDEQEAWCSTAVMFDQSFHMTDIYFEGPDVRRLLSNLGVNTFSNFGANRAKQFVACNHEGFVIGDAILFGHTDTKVSLVGRPAAPNWLAYNALTQGYDVEVTRDERSVDNEGRRRLFRYQIQGPYALDVIHKAASGPVPEVKPFHIGEFEIAGHTVRGLGHTMSRHAGMEIAGPWDAAEEVKRALLEAGEEFGLVQGGARSYPTTSFESGWIASPMPAIYSGETMRHYREWLSADSWEANASLGGSFTSDNIEDYYLTPWDLGYGGLVKFDHDFVGRSALEKLAQQPHRRRVWAVWNDDDVQTVIGRSLFGGDSRTKYLDLPLAVYATLPYDKIIADDRVVGFAAYTGYTTNLRKVVSLAMVDEAIPEGTCATLVWGEENGGSSKPTVETHVQSEVRVSISATPPLAT